MNPAPGLKCLAEKPLRKAAKMPQNTWSILTRDTIKILRVV